MRISELGEFGLIDLLTKTADSATDKKLDSWQQLVIGIGDDAAAWQSGALTQLATVDSLVQDVHFSLDVISWEDLGWKALAANLSDIAAMGGIPKYALVSLALPDDTEVSDVAALYRGIAELAQHCETAIIGGDISRAPVVVITITVLGVTSGQSILTRGAATYGEQVVVTGYLGAAAAGLKMLSNQLQFETKATTQLRNAFLHPHPRIAEGQRLAHQGVKAAIDISDGLLADLTHICQQSQVGARLEIDRVPVHPAAKAGFGDKSLELALSGGEDYELLFTAAAGIVNGIKAAVSCPISVIGAITKDNVGEVVPVDSRGNTVSFSRRGWEHFSPG